MNLLIVKLSAIGDVLLSLPMLEALRRTFPQAHISWLVEDAAADILTDHPSLDQVIVWPRRRIVKDIKEYRWGSAGRDLAGFWRRFKNRPYDIVIDTHGLIKSAIFTYLSGGPRRIGHDQTEEMSYLALNDRLPPYYPDRHALLRYLDVAAYLGAVVTDVPFFLPPSPVAAAAAGEFLTDPSHPLVVVNPGAKWPTKLWPDGSWRELLTRLSKEFGRVILTGGPEEMETNSQISREIKGVVDLTGRTSLRVLGEIIRAADVMVSPDTGPMHLAAAVGTKVVALFGPTAPWRTGPFGSGHMVIRTGIPCSPCFSKKCPDPRCLTDISPDRVFQVVREQLAPAGSRSRD